MWAALTAERLYRRRTQTGFVGGLKSFRICRVRANVPFLLQVVNGALFKRTLPFPQKFYFCDLARKNHRL